VLGAGEELHGSLRFEFITHSNAFFHTMRHDVESVSRETEVEPCTCHGQSNNSINLLHKSMRYWQYDDEADCFGSTTINDERRTSNIVDLHYAETVGQELELQLDFD